MHFWEHVQNFTDDEGAEGDGYYVGERLVEKDYRAKHDHAALEDGLPRADQERLGWERSSLLQAWVKDGELHDSWLAAVFIRDQREYREHCVNGGVSED